LRPYSLFVAAFLCGSFGCRQQATQVPAAKAVQAAQNAGIADRPLPKTPPARSASKNALAKASARFVAFGDTGIGSPTQMRVAKSLAAFCTAQRCDFALHTGDIVYPAGIRSVDDPYLLQRLERPYAGLGVPMYLSLGNHDRCGNADAMVQAWAAGSPARKRGLLDARLPGPWYTFAHSGVRFVVLDTHRRGQAQARWADQVLADSAKRNETWVVALGHHPLRSSGQHGDAFGEQRMWLRGRLCGRVDVYIAGHDHNKEILEPECGVHQVVSGAGGQLRPISPKAGSIWAASTLGWAWFVASGQNLSVAFVDEHGKIEAKRTLTRQTGKR